jgi:hypothetical protein
MNAWFKKKADDQVKQAENGSVVAMNQRGAIECNLRLQYSHRFR